MRARGMGDTWMPDIDERHVTVVTDVPEDDESEAGEILELDERKAVPWVSISGLNKKQRAVLSVIVDVLWRQAGQGRDVDVPRARAHMAAEVARTPGIDRVGLAPLYESLVEGGVDAETAGRCIHETFWALAHIGVQGIIPPEALEHVHAPLARTTTVPPPRPRRAEGTSRGGRRSLGAELMVSVSLVLAATPVVVTLVRLL